MDNRLSEEIEITEVFLSKSTQQDNVVFLQISTWI